MGKQSPLSLCSANLTPRGHVGESINPENLGIFLEPYHNSLRSVVDRIFPGTGRSAMAPKQDGSLSVRYQRGDAIVNYRFAPVKGVSGTYKGELEIQGADGLTTFFARSLQALLEADQPFSFLLEASLENTYIFSLRHEDNGEQSQGDELYIRLGLPLPTPVAYLDEENVWRRSHIACFSHDRKKML